jgi:hypothetical protein
MDVLKRCLAEARYSLRLTLLIARVIRSGVPFGPPEHRWSFQLAPFEDAGKIFERACINTSLGEMDDEGREVVTTVENGCDF